MSAGKITSALCAACGAITRHAFCFEANHCRISRCLACGLGRTHAEGFNPHSYYTGDYFAGGRNDGYADYLGAEPVLRREFRRSVEFVRRHRDGGRLLELGCAYGFFLQEAQPYYDVSGIELAEEAATYCRRAGLKVLSGTADEQKLSQLGDLDVIVMFDVIEHLPDPGETLALCTRHLRPDGIIVLTTGDFGSPLAKLSGARWRLMTPPQHLWFFTVEGLRRLAASVGLVLERSDHPWKIVPLSLVLFQLRRMAGFPGAAPASTSHIGLPVNLFDAARVVLRKPAP